MSITSHRLSLPKGYVLGEYRIERVLGQTAFYTTYLATVTSPKQTIAIKEYLPIELVTRNDAGSLHPVTSETKDVYRLGRDRFSAEAKTLARTDDLNKGRIRNVLDANNTVYAVMAFEDGETLAVFDRPTGSSLVANFFDRIGNLVRHGSVRDQTAETEGFGRWRSLSERSREPQSNVYFDWRPEDYRRFIFAWKPESVRTQFNHARTGMIARLQERIGAAPALERAELERGLEAVKRVRFEIDPSPDIYAEPVERARLVRVSMGLINEVVARVRGTNVDEARSRTLGRNVLVFIISRELAHVCGIKAEDFADVEGVKAVEKAVGPISELDIRTAMEALDRPVDSYHTDTLINL